MSSPGMLFSTSCLFLNLIPCSVLSDETDKLDKLIDKFILKWILESEKVAKDVQDTIRRIDESLKIFQVSAQEVQIDHAW